MFNSMSRRTAIQFVVLASAAVWFVGTVAAVKVAAWLL